MNSHSDLKQIIVFVILYFDDTCVERPTNVDQLQKRITLCGAFSNLI